MDLRHLPRPDELSRARQAALELRKRSEADAFEMPWVAGAREELVKDAEAVEALVVAYEALWRYCASLPENRRAQP